MAAADLEGFAHSAAAQDQKHTGKALTCPNAAPNPDRVEFCIVLIELWSILGNSLGGVLEGRLGPLKYPP